MSWNRSNFMTTYDFLSAAHCFKSKGFNVPMAPEQVRALVGRFNLKNHNESGSKNASVQEIVLHPDWDSDGDKFDADIAIIVLSQPVKYSDRIQPVCVLTTNQDPVGLGTIVGWGKSSLNSEYDDTPNQLEIPAVNSSYCYTKFPKLADYSSHRAFCAGFEKKERGSCSGDSGGGFYMYDSTEHVWSVVGIVSNSLVGGLYGCDVNNLVIYTNAGLFVDWILKEAKRTANIKWKSVEIQCIHDPLIIW